MTRSANLVVLPLLSIVATPSVLAAGRQFHNNRWGALCLGFMEPWLCKSDVADYWIKENCLEVNNTQMQVLVDFYYYTGNQDDSGPLYEMGWLEHCDYCSWGGITCNQGGNVTGIDSTEMDPPLTGSVPTELALLESLESLLLSGNEFDEVPTEIGKLYNLTRLELHYNDLTGQLPLEICSLGLTNGTTTLGLMNGTDIYISADCGRPNPQITCPTKTCCHACYIDALRGKDDDKKLARAEAIAQASDALIQP